MRRRHIPESHSAHPNVTPLIDIIMCLIIFFMLVAKIGVTTGAEKIDIPATFLGTKIDDMSNTLTLNIPAETATADLPRVSALVKRSADSQATMQDLQLQDATGQNQLKNVLIMYKKQNPQFKVIIRADASLAWRFIEPVLMTCNDAGVRSINFNTARAKS